MDDVFDKKNEALSGPEDRAQKERRAIDFTRSFMQHSREYRQPHLELATASRELYHCWVALSRSPINRANLKLPYAFAILQEELPKIVEALLNERPIAVVEALKAEDIALEDGMTDFLDIQIEQMSVTLKFIEYITSLLLDGTAIAKVPYRYEEKTRKVRRFENDPNGAIKAEQDVEFRVAYDGPDFRPISFVDFFPDWTATRPGDIQGMRGCAERMYKSLEELKANPAYRNFDALEQSVRIKGSGGDVAWNKPYWSEENQASVDASRDNKPGIKNGNLVEVWEYWGFFDETGKGDFSPYVITIANGDVVLRCEENPFAHEQKPYVATPNYVRDNEFFGIPELIVIRSQVKEAQVLRNARLDQVNLNMYRMYVVDRASGIKARSLFSRPNGIVWANDINGIKPLDAPDILPGAQRELQELQAEMKDTLGVLQGAAVNPLQRNAARSATGVQWVNSIAASRVGLKVRILSETLIKPMFNLMLQYNDQFVTDEQWVRVNDPEQAAQNPFTLLPQSAFERALDFRIKSTFDTGGKEAELDRLQQLGQLLQVAEGTQPGITKWDVLIETIGKDLVGSKYKKFIRSDQERMALQQQGAMQQQAAQAMAGKGAPQPNAKPGAPAAPAPSMMPVGGSHA